MQCNCGAMRGAHDVLMLSDVLQRLSLSSAASTSRTRPNEKGERWIWLDPSVVDRLRYLRGPGESYSDVILRLAKGDA